MRRLSDFDPALPVVLVGDFNAGRNPVYDLLVDRGGFVDTWRAAGHAEPPFGTYPAFEGAEGAMGRGRIDWVLARGPVRTLAAEIVTFSNDGRYPSDHFPRRRPPPARGGGWMMVHLARWRTRRRPCSRIRTISLAALLGGCTAVLVPPSPASAQDSVVVATAHLRMAVAPATGAVALRVLGEGASDAHRTDAPALYLDGVRQEGFRVVRREAPMLLRNGALELEIEVLGERAVALTWTARDTARHDFELQLRSGFETGFYGAGERFNALDQRGYILPVVTDDRADNKGVGSYKPVPFFMSTDGYAVWVDSYAPGLFDLNGTDRFLARLRFPDTRLRVVFFGGPRFSDLLEAFTALTGRTRVPPPWAFGLWKSRDVHHNQDSVYVDIEKLRRYGIPASVIVLDSPWETGYNDFEINRQQFPEPERMFARIEELGFHLCVWLTPFVNRRNVIDMEGITPASSNYAEAAERGYLVEDGSGSVMLSEWWKGEGGLVDFTDPAAVAWWHQQLAKTKPYGARAFKVDDGEGNFVPAAVFHDGTPAIEMKNRYAALYDSVMQAYVDERLGGDGVLITRSGYTGTQRYPFDWAGDNQADFSYSDGLPTVVLAAQSAALSGIPLWGSDIAGYVGVPSAELFVRWTQLATFSPFMQVHMTSNLGPWDFGEEALAIFREFAVLRVRLFPYLYQAVHEAARSGMPVIRPMVLAFQDDAAAHRHRYQYLFGPDLLVAPLYQPGTRRAVYLPEGRWLDFWTGEAHAGPRLMEVEAPLDRIPLFVRAGAILPLLPDDVQTLIPRHERMAPEIVAMDERRVLQVWPGGSGAVETWDGLSASLETQGGTARLRVSASQPRPLEVHLPHRRVERVEAQGAAVRYDAALRATVIAFPDFRGTRTLTWAEP